MNKEEFVYQFLLNYNEYEKRFKEDKAVDFWKKYDKTNGTSGLIFYVLRNALVHNTAETTSQITKIKAFSIIIDELKDCQLEIDDRMKYLSYFLDNENVKQNLTEKNFEIINTNRQDIFKLFQRKVDDFYCTLTFSHTNLMFDSNVSTYNHQKACKETFEGYYIESELNDNQYIIKFFKDKTSVSLYVNNNFNPKYLYQSIEFIDVFINTMEYEPNVEIKLDALELDKYENSDFSKFFNEYLCDTTVRKALKKIKKLYEKMNEVLHVIGIQNNV